TQARLGRHEESNDHCEPGTRLRELPEEEQVVLGRLASRLWKAPPAGHPFRPLSAMIEQWIAENWSRTRAGPTRTSCARASTRSVSWRTAVRGPCCSRPTSTRATCCAQRET